MACSWNAQTGWDCRCGKDRHGYYFDKMMRDYEDKGVHPHG